MSLITQVAHKSIRPLKQHINSIRSFKFSRKTKSYLTVVGTSLIYFAMGLYFAAGNTGVYLTSYLIYRSGSGMKLDDAIWFLSAAGFSALLLPMGGLLERKVGVRGVCAIGGILQSFGIFVTYFALDTTFLVVVIVYGGSFLVSLATCYTSPLVNVCKWHPNHKGLVSGIGTASMALAPTLFTPLITSLVNPKNLPANELGLFNDPEILDLTQQSTIIQGTITLTLFALGITFTFPAECEEKSNGGNKFYTHSDSDDQVNSISLTKFHDISEFKRPQDNGLFIIQNYEMTHKSQQQVEYPQAQIDNSANSPSIEPKEAFRTSEFWLLSLKVLISELIFIYLLFIYKPYGQTFIQDDYFLSAVGAACAISNTFGRLSMGHVKDLLGFKAVSIPLSTVTLVSVLILPLTKQLSKIFYGIAIVLGVGAVGSQYALIPSAAQDCFGDKYASINIGFVYMSTVLATVSSALLSQHLTSLIGWEGMIYLVAGCAGVDFVATFLMPSSPRERLEKRYRRIQLKKNRENSGAEI